MTNHPSLGHPLFQVPHLFRGQSFTVQAEGKPLTLRNGFSLEIGDVTPALYPPRSSPRAGGAPLTAQLSMWPAAGGGPSRSVRQE